MGRRILLAAVAFVTVLIATERGPRADPERAPFVGQWIWTRADAERYAETAPRVPGLGAAVFVGTIEVEGDTIRWRRGLSPTVAPGDAVVLRFDDSFHRALDGHAPEALAATVGEEVRRVVDQVAATGVRVHELQLDYDAPVRLLDRWAALVRALSAGTLADVDLWVTSIPAHLAEGRYGRLFEGAVAGHILQVFDTGLACTEAQGAALAADLRRADLRYRVGVGAFERGNATDHGCWIRAWPRLARSERFAGLWVFPAGHRYVHLIAP